MEKPIWIDILYPGSYRMRKDPKLHHRWVRERIPLPVAAHTPDDAPVAYTVAPGPVLDVHHPDGARQRAAHETVVTWRDIDGKLVRSLRNPDGTPMHEADLDRFEDVPLFLTQWGGSPWTDHPFHVDDGCRDALPDHVQIASREASREDVEGGRDNPLDYAATQVGNHAAARFWKWTEDRRDEAMDHARIRAGDLHLVDGILHAVSAPPLVELVLQQGVVVLSVVIPPDGWRNDDARIYFPIEAMTEARACAEALVSDETHPATRIADRIPTSGLEILSPREDWFAAEQRAVAAFARAFSYRLQNGGPRHDETMHATALSRMASRHWAFGTPRPELVPEAMEAILMAGRTPNVDPILADYARLIEIERSITASFDPDLDDALDSLKP